MHTELVIDAGLFYSFAIVLARVSGFLLMVPLPGVTAGPNVTRVVLALALTVCMLPLCPHINTGAVAAELVIWIVAEFAIGLVMGLCLALLFEAFQMAAQVIGLQAGFSYASTVDPSTQADTSVLQTILQLFTGILFVGMGLHLQLIKLLAAGLGEEMHTPSVAKAFNPAAVIQLGTLMFTTGLRLAMPVIGSLLLVDLAFALLSKVHSQLQLLSFSFSMKMLAGLALIAVVLTTCPTLLGSTAGKMFETLLHLLT